MAQLNTKPTQDQTWVEAPAKHPSSYISALKHISAQASTCAPQNRMIERLRECTDLELESFGIKRSEIERLVYGQKLA